MIFLWTVLILAGLLGLLIEFYRVTPSPCTHDNYGNPIPQDAALFPYEQAKCDLTCSDDAPRSPMRGGSASNIYVVPVPSQLTFNAAMLLAAGSCLPAILSLIFTWDKILEKNWRSRFGGDNEEAHVNEPIKGTNGATPGKMMSINDMVRHFLSVIEIPLFGGAVLSILCIGEINFFSKQVRYQTEPVASIGQWAPIAGTCFAALGSLYLLVTGDKNSDEESPGPNPTTSHCDSSHSDTSDAGMPLRSVTPTESRLDRNTTDAGEGADPANRRTIARWLDAVGNYLGDVVHERVGVSGDSGYVHDVGRDFPEVPAEVERNANLDRIRTLYREIRELYLQDQLFRRGSFAASDPAAVDADERSVPAPGPALARFATSPSPNQTRGRSATLQIPPTVHHRSSL